MLFKLFVLVLVLLITFFQSITGLFSALIMFLLTLACASLAFGLYETVFESLIGQHLPAYGHAVALIGVFVISLAVTRVLADTLIKRNMEFPGLIDRIGGGVFGFCSALMMTGMLAISIQMLPFGRDILGYQCLAKVDVAGDPVEDTRQGSDPNSFRFQRSGGLWLSPDGFAVKLVSLMSRGSFSGAYDFDAVHPEFLNELQMVRYGPQKESLPVAAPDAIRVQAVWPLQDDQLQNADLAQRAPTDHWLCVRTRIANSERAQDSDKIQRFIPMHVRLVGWPRERGAGPTRQYTPVGVAMKVLENTPYGEHLRLPADQPLMIPRGLADAVIDFVYEVPTDFVPWFVSYKRGGFAEITQTVLSAGPPRPEVVEAIAEPDELQEEEPSDDDEEEDGESTDRVSGRHVRAGQSRFDRALPVALEPSWMVGTEKEFSGGQFHSGQVVADWPLFEAELSVAVTHFFVPPNLHLYQLSVTKDEAQSIFGRALNFARNTLAQFIVRDEQGDVYFRIGEVRIANVSGQQKIEIQYWPQAEIPERCIREARTVKDVHLKGNEYTLIYLYLLPDGRKPVEFDTGNRIRKIK